MGKSKYNKSQKFVLLLQQLQQKNGAFAGDLKAEFDLDDRIVEENQLYYEQDLDIHLKEGNSDHWNRYEVEPIQYILNEFE